MDNNNYQLPSDAPASVRPIGPQSTIVTSDPNPAKNKKRLILIIVIVTVVLLGAGGFFLWKYKFAPKSSSEIDEVVTVYSTPVNSEDPEGDFIEHLESEIDSAETTAEALTAIINRFDYACVFQEDYDSALKILSDINISTYSDPTDLYKIYSAYARLYSAENLNDSTLYEEYTAKADEQLKLITGE